MPASLGKCPPLINLLQLPVSCAYFCYEGFTTPSIGGQSPSLFSINNQVLINITFTKAVVYGVLLLELEAVHINLGHSGNKKKKRRKNRFTLLQNESSPLSPHSFHLHFGIIKISGMCFSLAILPTSPTSFSVG